MNLPGLLWLIWFGLCFVFMLLYGIAPTPSFMGGTAWFNQFTVMIYGGGAMILLTIFLVLVTLWHWFRRLRKRVEAGSGESTSGDA